MHGLFQNATSHPELERWLRQFASAVRARDYDAGRALFDDQVLGFGTVSECALGLDQLCREQWRPIWDHTEGFAFDLASTCFWSQGESVMIMASWSSMGIHADGGRRQRCGRATILLARAGDGFKALHTHFSMVPGSSA